MLKMSAEAPRSQPLSLPRDEMAFRKRYESLLLMGRITTVFRPGNRVFPMWRGYKRGETITARVIERPGCDVAGYPPVFNDVQISITIADIEVLPVAALRPHHFVGSSPDVVDVPSLEAHLFEIYGEPLSAYDNLLTRIALQYAPDPSRQRLAAQSVQTACSPDFATNPNTDSRGDHQRFDGPIDASFEIGVAFHDGAGLIQIGAPDHEDGPNHGVLRVTDRARHRIATPLRLDPCQMRGQMLLTQTGAVRPILANEGVHDAGAINLLRRLLLRRLQQT
jgi:hypothetical protein